MSEIDKTIEELEQEVLADLSEADALKKGAGKPDPMQKSDAQVDDTGAAVVKSDEKKKSRSSQSRPTTRLSRLAPSFF